MVPPSQNHAQSLQKKREWKLEYGRRRKGRKEEATKRTRERERKTTTKSLFRLQKPVVALGLTPLYDS